jgi:hypothetical protein
MKHFVARENQLWHGLVANSELLRFVLILLLMAAVGAVLSHWEPAEPWSDESYCLELTDPAATDIAKGGVEPIASETCS